MTKAKIQNIREMLGQAAPELTAAVFNHLAPLLIPNPAGKHDFPKSGYYLNDPVWKTVTLTQLQAAIIKLPLLQRLRRVRQLGLAYLVFPSANHTRFEHSLGAAHAALQMFDHLASEAGLKDREKVYFRLREAIEVAALLHDCGHTVFSHVGERVLQQMYKDDFVAVQKTLSGYYPTVIKQKAAEENETNTLKSERPPAAELLSSLIVLSPTFEKYLESYVSAVGNISSGVPALIDDSCALILGKDLAGAVDSHRNSYNFVTTLLSGDIDADKIDYVGRDAYFAGLPVSADIHRLLLQLTVANVTAKTRLENLKIDFTDGSPNRYCFQGISPSGTSTLEMFVLTRSYLFDRLYTHHKVRSAERALERLLFQKMQFRRQFNGKSLAENLKYLFSSGGDDYVLSDISTTDISSGAKIEIPKENLQQIANGFDRRVEKIQGRQLPHRVLAISSRFQQGYEKNRSYRKSSEIVLPWNDLDRTLSTDGGRKDFEREICSLCGLESGVDVYIDYPVPNPIKENPAIWVSDPTECDAIYRVNRYFNAEQLSNSYQDVKQLIWIFADRDKEELPRIAAAFEYLLFKNFRVAISSDAFRRAKIQKSRVEVELRAFGDKFKANGSTDELEYVEYLLQQYDQRPLDVRKNDFLRTFSPFLTEGEISETAVRISNAFKKTKLSIVFSDQYNTSLQVVKYLLGYAKSCWAHPKFREEESGKNEYRFHQDLKQHLVSSVEVSSIFEIIDGPKTAGGIPDLVFQSKFASTKVYVELKSVNERFEKLYDENAKQPSEYASSQGERISILFCQFGQDTPVTLGQTLQIRETGELTTGKHVIFCLGMRVFASLPSSSGGGTIKVE
jgi:HD superfamily phosphohydrolase